MTAEPPLVEVDGLTFRYRRATEPAITDLSLTVSPGQVILVAGPSGCGKSTLIRAINGLIPHAYPGELSGAVRVEGRATTELKLRDIARTVGTVLQDPAKQIVGATVESELAFGPENMGTPREEIRDRIRDVAERAGIEPLLGRETAALSGGERQLLAMAGILMMQPRLYVVDEPLANLDPATAERLLDILRALADRGDAIVIVEHRVEEAMRASAGPRALSRGGARAVPGSDGRIPRHRRSRGGQAPVRRRPRAHAVGSGDAGRGRAGRDARDRVSPARDGDRAAPRVPSRTGIHR